MGGHLHDCQGVGADQGWCHTSFNPSLEFAVQFCASRGMQLLDNDDCYHTNAIKACNNTCMCSRAGQTVLQNGMLALFLLVMAVMSHVDLIATCCARLAMLTRCLP